MVKSDNILVNPLLLPDCIPISEVFPFPVISAVSQGFLVDVRKNEEALGPALDLDALLPCGDNCKEQ